MNNHCFSGVLVPVLTPFLPDQTPNTEAFVQHSRWLLDQGADGLAVFGTTSEANSLTNQERMDLLDALIENGIDPARLLPGTGTCSVPDSVLLTRHATERGCGGVLMLPPFYYKGVGDDGLYSFFDQVINGVGDTRLKIYLYHIPPMSQTPISLQLVERLRKDHPSVVVGLKDSGGDWNYTAAILQNFPELAVFPGSESFLLEGLRHGGVGCITASGNVNPAGIRTVFERWQEADADALQSNITHIRKIIQSHPMIPALKAILADFYQQPQWLEVRPPLSKLGDAKKNQLMSDLEASGFSMGNGG